ncbi:MAG: T9SS type A sorting domain-containing protein [Cytophagaceae bacterium]|jgi:hypothetical protein|nr:T9SS type A sorting domain-containing protein [Cytophagaceae bacterium]
MSVFQTLLTDNVSVSELSSGNVSIYPNPINGKLTIDGLRHAETPRWGGHLPPVQQNGAITLNISHLLSGVYFIQIEKDGKTHTVKVVKM